MTATVLDGRHSFPLAPTRAVRVTPILNFGSILHVFMFFVFFYIFVVSFWVLPVFLNVFF